MVTIAENLTAVRQRIADAARKAGRQPSDVRLLAVSKTFPAADIADAYANGAQHCFGENRVQELEEKAPILPQEIQWHLIGHLQANKVRNAVKFATWIHSVDSLELLERIERIAEEEHACPHILLEVNISGEESKFGLTPEQADELAGVAKNMTHLKLEGLMTMAPFEAPADELHRVFGGLRELRDHIAQHHNITLPELSMGMSGDFEAAIAEGATIVRIGTAIFGHR
jgi:PLP dependent protein